MRIQKEQDETPANGIFRCSEVRGGAKKQPRSNGGVGGLIGRPIRFARLSCLYFARIALRVTYKTTEAVAPIDCSKAVGSRWKQATVAS